MSELNLATLVPGGSTCAWPFDAVHAAGSCCGSERSSYVSLDRDVGFARFFSSVWLRFAADSGGNRASDPYTTLVSFFVSLQISLYSPFYKSCKISLNLAECYRKTQSRLRLPFSKCITSDLYSLSLPCPASTWGRPGLSKLGCNTSMRTQYAYVSDLENAAVAGRTSSPRVLASKDCLRLR